MSSFVSVPIMKNAQVVCFAKSRKWRGYCFAGKCRDDGRWIRPVSSLECGTLYSRHMRYWLFCQPKVLDILEIPLEKEEWHLFQTENYRIDEKRKWKKTGRLHFNEVARYVDYPETLWLNGFNSGHGKNDRIPDREIMRNHIRSSLFLIKPDFLRVGLVEGYKGNQVRAYFKYNGVAYNFPVTDPVVEKEFKKTAVNSGCTMDCGGLFLCISLGEVFGGNAYKLVAGIIRQ